MKKRFAYGPDDLYQQIRIDETFFRGIVCSVKIQNVSKPKYVKKGKETLCIIDNGYSLIEAYPDDGKYALTIMFDDKGKLIEWYFDIAKTVGTENGIPFEDDLYLDLVIMPDGESIVLDEDELLSARDKGLISQEDVDGAYSTLQELKSKYACCMAELIKLTDFLTEQFRRSSGFVEASHMEIWDLYNERRELTGRDHPRGEEIPQGYYHLVVHAWIRNSKNEYLISQRSADRSMYPLKWECVGGSVLKGEDSLSGVLREIKEEVGLSLSRKEGKLVRSTVGRVINGVKFSDIVDVWLFEYDGPVSLEKATTKEVAQTHWMGKSQIKELFDRGDLVDALGYFFEEGLF